MQTQNHFSSHVSIVYSEERTLSKIVQWPCISVCQKSLQDVSDSGGFRLGPGGHRPPKSCPGPPKFLIGSVVHCFY